MKHVDNNKTHFMLDTLKWIGLYAGIGLIASLLLPFPISLVVALGAFIAINFLIDSSKDKEEGY